MSKSASKFQKVLMSWVYRGKEIFKPLNTGAIDEHVRCVREYVANIFFYTKGDTTIMIDAGYSYDRLQEKMDWLGIDPKAIKHILITHLDTDHIGAIEADSDQLFSHAQVYIGDVENRYLTLLHDGEVFEIDGIKIEAILVPGHTWGHVVYLIDDKYVFSADTIWFGADGGYSFINKLAEDNQLAVESLAKLEGILRQRGLNPKIITGHTGWTDDINFAFAHTDEVCNVNKPVKVHDSKAPYDAYDERDDTRESAVNTPLLPCNR